MVFLINYYYCLFYANLIVIQKELGPFKHNLSTYQKMADRYAGISITP